MKALDLDFVRERRLPIVGWAMLCAALFALADSGLQIMALNDNLDRAERLLRDERAGTRGRAVVTKALDPALLKDMGQAQQVLNRLSLPWDDLFRTVETAKTDRVALLALDPDAQKGELSISGEAADYEAVLAYAARLQQQGRLSAVHLVRHEVKRDDPERRVAFTLAANWETDR
jgi:Tfp pilus assembly protein PilN